MKKAEIVANSLVLLIIVGAFITVFSFVNLTGKVISEKQANIDAANKEQVCIINCAAALNCTNANDPCISLVQNECLMQCGEKDNETYVLTETLITENSTE